MRKTAFYSLISATLVLGAMFTGCGSDNSGTGTPGTSTDSLPVRGDYVRVHLSAEPDGLNPFNTINGASTEVKANVFQYVLTIDPMTLKMVPCLAERMPEVSPDGTQFTFVLRKEAVWDDGKPITGYDYEFSVKALLNPQVNSAASRAGFELVSDVKVDSLNPRKFTVYCKEAYVRSEATAGGINVIPRHLYDPQGYMNHISVADLASKAPWLETDSNLKRFADMFNSEEYNRDPSKVFGSGPYRVKSWVTGQEIRLERKKGWWGDKMDQNDFNFQAYPDEIIYKVITDRSTAVVDLTGEGLDIMKQIPPEDFKNFEEQKGTVPQKYNLYKPDLYQFNYLGLNTRPSLSRNPALADTLVRRALTHLVDIPYFIDSVILGYGKPVVSPVPPQMKDEYNSDLKPYEYSPEKAKALFIQAGWVTTDPDGIRTKIINGRKYRLSIEFMYSNSSPLSPALARLLKESAEIAGMEITSRSMEFNVMLEKLKAHEFDIFQAGFSMPPLPSDFKQLLHTSEYLNGSSNYFGFGNAHSDSLLIAIRSQMNPAIRIPMVKELQQIVYDAVPMIFLAAPQERMAIHKRYHNVRPSSLRPGYQPNEMWVPRSEQRVVINPQ